jgi:hypothetical protein
MVAQRSGDTLRQGKRQGQAAKRPDPLSPGNSLIQKAKRKGDGKRSKGSNTKNASPPAVASTSARRVVAQNLINMLFRRDGLGHGAAGTSGRPAF